MFEKFNEKTTIISPRYRNVEKHSNRATRRDKDEGKIYQHPAANVSQSDSQSTVINVIPELFDPLTNE